MGSSKRIRAYSEEEKRRLSLYSVNVKRKKKLRAVEYKGGKCQRCGYSKSVRALQFHHRDPREKDFNISHTNASNWEMVKVELDKCDMLCANCHCEEHERLDAEVKQRKEAELATFKRVDTRVSVPCSFCNQQFLKKKSRFEKYSRHYCSPECCRSDEFLSGKRFEWPSDDEFKKLVWTKSMNAIAAEMGCSNRIVKKRCVKLGIETPPLGYWNGK